MKRIFILIIIICIYHVAFSQQIQEDNRNNVLCVWSNPIELKLDGKLQFGLANFIGDGISEYYIVARFLLDDKHNHHFPCNCKLIFQTIDEKTIELSSIVSEMDEFGFPMAYYPITTDKLEILYKGVRLIRMELLKYIKENRVDRIFPEKKYSKDQLGLYLQQSFNAIENEKSKKNCN